MVEGLTANTVYVGLCWIGASHTMASWSSNRITFDVADGRTANRRL